MVDSNNAFNAILADALLKTSIQGNKIDMADLMKYLCGNYIVDGKKVTKNAPESIPEECGANRRRDA